MALPGRLGKDRFGPAQPVDAPLYGKPPYYYRGAESLSLTYETGEEAAADLLSEGWS